MELVEWALSDCVEEQTLHVAGKFWVAEDATHDATVRIGRLPELLSRRNHGMRFSVRAPNRTLRVLKTDRTPLVTLMGPAWVDLIIPDGHAMPCAWGAGPGGRVVVTGPG